MTIQTKQGDLLDISSGILVHGCNCHGVMGSGVAGALRAKWSDAFAAYRKRYDQSGLQLGDVVFVANPAWSVTPAARHLHAFSAQLPRDVIVANAMTQFDFGREPGKVYVDYDAISAAFVRIRMLARDTGLDVHFPLIGCGLAQGKWEDVAPRIERALGPAIGKTLWMKD